MKHTEGWLGKGGPLSIPSPLGLRSRKQRAVLTLVSTWGFKWLTAFITLENSFQILLKLSVPYWPSFERRKRKKKLKIKSLKFLMCCDLIRFQHFWTVAHLPCMLLINWYYSLWLVILFIAISHFNDMFEFGLWALFLWQPSWNVLTWARVLLQCRTEAVWQGHFFLKLRYTEIILCKHRLRSSWF